MQPSVYTLKMQRRHFLPALFSGSIGFSAHAALPEPQTFRTQINQGIKRLENWSKVDNTRDGSWRKVSLKQIQILKLDVVRSESLLRPYTGILHMLFTVVFGEHSSTQQEAEASPVIVEKDLGNTSTFECEYEFGPGDRGWSFITGRSRSSASIAAGDSGWLQLNASTVKAGSGIHKPVIEILSAPVTKSTKPVKPAKRPLQM